MEFFGNSNAELHSKLNELDGTFADTGGVIQGLSKLSDQYILYANGILQIAALEAKYLEKAEQKDQIEAEFGITSMQARHARKELNDFGLELDRERKPEIYQKLSVVGEQMKYQNPVVWFIYKTLAYSKSILRNQQLAIVGKPVSLPINTVEELIKHGLASEGYICGRRLHFLAVRYAESLGKSDVVNLLTGLDPWKMKPSDFVIFAGVFGTLGLDTEIPHLLINEEFINLCADIQLEWQEFELSEMGKWNTYSLIEE